MAAKEFSLLSLFSDANLVSYYKMENVNDSKGSNTLTNNGTVAFNAGLFNNAADFGNPNSSKYFSGAYTFVNTNTDFSVGWWFKAPDNSNAYVSFMSDVGGGGGDEIYMGVGSAGGVDFHMVNSDGSENDQGGSITGFDGTVWNHIMFTVVKSGSNYDKNIYHNGALIANTTITSKNSGKLGSIRVARFAATGTYVYDGLCDDLVIFNRALTADEISLIYNGPPSAGFMAMF